MWTAQDQSLLLAGCGMEYVPFGFCLVRKTHNFTLFTLFGLYHLATLLANTDLDGLALVEHSVGPVRVYPVKRGQ
jgi:hypothetical protein